MNVKKTIIKKNIQQETCNYNVTPEWTRNISGTWSSSQTVNNNGFIVTPDDFPKLEKAVKSKIQPINHNTARCIQSTEEKIGFDKKKHSHKPRLLDFMSKSCTDKAETHTENKLVACSYKGNPLDSDLPQRRKGKIREKPKRPSKLKQCILNDQIQQTSQSSEEVSILRPTYIFDISPDAEKLIENFITEVVNLQEKMYKRNQIKGVYKRRHVVGLHEAKKYLNLNRTKIIFFASDIKFTDTLHSNVGELIDLCKSHGTLYAFALKRRTLGKLTLKFIPVSCVSVLNYEGLEELFKEIKLCIEVYFDAKNEETRDEIKNDVLSKLMLALKC